MDLINIMTWGGGLGKTLLGRTIFLDTADSDQLASGHLIRSALFIFQSEAYTVFWF